MIFACIVSVVGLLFAGWIAGVASNKTHSETGCGILFLFALALVFGFIESVGAPLEAVTAFLASHVSFLANMAGILAFLIVLVADVVIICIGMVLAGD